MSDPEDPAGPVAPAGPVDEFEAIARLLRPLTGGAPEAFDLLDDAAAIPSRPGHDLIVSQDAMVEGGHFLKHDPPGLVARKLLRTNLSDLAAKGAQPYAYFLAVAWPAAYGWPQRRAFAEGLALDQAEFGLVLLGGDTVATPGPLTASVTILGWVPAGRMVRRGAAAPGDRLLVTGSIGDGGLGLRAARGELSSLSPADRAWLADRYRLPQPRNGLAEALRDHASAAADVSDGLVADAGRIAIASGAGLRLDLDRLPLSAPAARWLAAQPDRTAALTALAVGGDDYEIVCAAPPDQADALSAAAQALGLPMADIGEVVAGEGVAVTCGGAAVAVGAGGYRHG
jgi:thiamine-monophosphate kinase